jgi:hypothetical protein
MHVQVYYYAQTRKGCVCRYLFGNMMIVSGRRLVDYPIQLFGHFGLPRSFKLIFQHGFQTSGNSYDTAT